ncbi:MAG TPA: energy transducer TonB [Pyrinomonadaceae bacterium]|nr:energy transducer TonB [Pyrinomonadaceae bacterium]
MPRMVLTFVATLFAANLLCGSVMGQQERKYPAYTLVTRSTEYGVKGEELRVWTSTRYESSTGDSRSVSKSDGYEHANLYRRGRGVYQSNSRTSRLIKEMSHAPGCPLRTAEELRADPKFARTEDVLGYTAYVLIDRTVKDLVLEHYYVAELGGGKPVKSKTTHASGFRFEAEPISIKLGEPDPLDVTGPDYLVIEQEPRWSNNLHEQVISKPDPEYPAEAIARGLSGTVSLMVTVDDLGQVVVAAVRPGSAPSPLREAAVEAAYKASFKPMVVDGRPAIARGFINYEFVLPK